MKRIILVLISLCLCLAMVSPAIAVSASKLVGYWKGTYTATVHVTDVQKPVKVKMKVKVAFASDGTCSFREDRAGSFTKKGEFYAVSNRLIMEMDDHTKQSIVGDPWDIWIDQVDFDLYSKLSGNTLTLKGFSSTNESYSENSVIKLKRIKPTIKKVSANKVALGNSSTITVNVDQYVDFVRMTDTNGRELKFSYDEFKNDKFRIEHTFAEKSNKVKIYAGMKTEDGFIFWSPAKSLTVKCK